MDSRIEQLREQLREDPSSRLFFQLGELLRKEGELEEATKVLQGGLEHHPRYVGAWVAFGRGLSALEQYEESELAFGKALELDPENAVAARLIGQAASARQDWVRAIKALKLARALSPRDEALEQEIRDVEERLSTMGRLEGPRTARVERQDTEPIPADAMIGHAPFAVSEAGAQAPEPFGSTGTEAAPTEPIPQAEAFVPAAPPAHASGAGPAVLDDPFGDLGGDDPFGAPPGVDPDASDVFDLELGPEAAGQQEAEAWPADDASDEAGVGDGIDAAVSPTAQPPIAPQPIAQPPIELPSEAPGAAIDDLGSSLETDPFMVVDDLGGDLGATAGGLAEADDVFGFAFDVSETADTADGVGGLELDVFAAEATEAAASAPFASPEPFAAPEPIAPSEPPEAGPSLVGSGFEPGLPSDHDLEDDDDDEDYDEDELEPEPEPDPDEELPYATLTLARLAIEQGDLELGERTVRAILAREPDHEEARRLLSVIAEKAEVDVPGAAGEEPAGAYGHEPSMAVGSEQSESQSDATRAKGTVHGEPDRLTGTDLTQAKIARLRRWLETVRIAAEHRAL